MSFHSDPTHLYPSAPLLQRLTQGAFRQHGLRSLRLWAWLRGLYGTPSWVADAEEDSDERAMEPTTFTYADWRDRFFTVSHPKGEAVPALHDPHCRCSVLTCDWLTPVVSSLPEWCDRLSEELNIEPDLLRSWLGQRLFGVTRRSLASDLHRLVDLSLLERQGRAFRLLPQLPDWVWQASEGFQGSSEKVVVVERAADHDRLFANLDLGAIAGRYAEPVAGQQRFFLDVDYIVRDRHIDLVEDWQERLYQLWRSADIPPVRLVYNSSRTRAVSTCIVYPVCCYYVRRSIYLCGFGQTPTGEGQWYNFRLDRIGNLQALSWEDGEIPFFVYDAYRQKSLPTPTEIRRELGLAWGFDFYLEPRLMVLRFDPAFEAGYVAGTFRHETFQRISYDEVWGYVQQCGDADGRSALESTLDRRSPDDPYYRAVYRHLDTNVRMRLRAWRPFGEVILPWSLRQEMAQEVREEFGWYWG